MFIVLFVLFITMKMINHEDILDFYSFLNYVHNSYDFTDEVKEWENLNDAIWVTLLYLF